MTRKAPVIIILLFVGVGLIVAGGIVLGTQTVISDSPAITCGSAITADDKSTTDDIAYEQVGLTCSIVRGVRSTGGTIALVLGISLVLAALAIAPLRPHAAAPALRSAGPPTYPYPGPLASR